MATGRLLDLDVRNAAPATGRLLALTVENDAPTATGRLLALDVRNEVLSGSGRLLALSVTNSNTTVQAVLSGPATVEPGELLTLSTAGTTGSPDTITVIQIAGPAFTLTRSGDSWSGPTPFVRRTGSPIIATFRETATKGGVSQTFDKSVTVYPHTIWRKNGAGVLIPVKAR